MKLLYVWIEKFRNITQQGIIVDDEYKISVEPDIEDFVYLDSENLRVLINENSSKLFRKTYRRKLNYKKNDEYTEALIDSPILNITALVGGNASGKTSIIECLHMRADQFNYRNDEQHYYFFVFLDEENHSIVVRSRDIWLINEETRKRDFRRNNGYEEYVFPLTDHADRPPIKSDHISHMVSVYQHRRQETEWVYSVMGLPTMPINLDRSNSRNTFLGVFNFLCDFPNLIDEANRLVIFLRDENLREGADYFTKEKLTYEEYKSYFIYRLANLLFGKLRDFLYHEKPRFTSSEKRIRRPEEDTLIKEDMDCAEVLSFCCFDFPIRNSTSLASTYSKYLPKENIFRAISFFRKSTYIYHGKSRYDRYIDSLEKLFNCLYDVEPKYFTALYKLEIPFKEELQNIVIAFWNCLESDLVDQNWSESITIYFEWLSAGEYQLAIMFSGFYQRITKQYQEFENRDLIILFDEPEMHMHPEAGRRFIKYLNCWLTNFKKRSLINHCQVILATHSPFIIQELGNYNNSIALVKKEKGQITIRDFNDLSQLKLPNRESYSFNLVMYYIFGVPTIELHNELYGVLQEVNQLYKTKDIDSWFRNKIPQNTLAIKEWKEEEGGKLKSKKNVPLQTYIRNSIHHPENQQNADFTPDEIRLSIEQMIDLSEQLKSEKK